jgi:hypothetical protein
MNEAIIRHAAGFVLRNGRSGVAKWRRLSVWFNRATETGVLVTTGNASFITGPRRKLLDLLHTLLQELQNSTK